MLGSTDHAGLPCALLADESATATSLQACSTGADLAAHSPRALAVYAVLPASRHRWPPTSAKNHWFQPATTGPTAMARPERPVYPRSRRGPWSRTSRPRSPRRPLPTEPSHSCLHDSEEVPACGAGGDFVFGLLGRSAVNFGVGVRRLATSSTPLSQPPSLAAPSVRVSVGDESGQAAQEADELSAPWGMTPLVCIHKCVRQDRRGVPWLGQPVRARRSTSG